MRYFTAPGEDRRLDEASRQSLRGSFARLRDGVTHYELTGPDGAEIAVLAGGLTVPLFYWDRLAAELHAHGLRTLAYSMYGRGYSDRVRATYDENLLARQLAGLLDALGLTRRLHLVGASLGAVISMAYAAGHQASLSTLTIIGPAGLGTQAAPLGRLLRSDLLAGLAARHIGSRMLRKHLGHNVRDQQLAAELGAMVADAYRYEGSMYALFETLQHLRLVGRHELYRDTAALGVPTLLLWGAEDQVTPASQADAARDLLGPRESHVIPDCGHMVPLERPGDAASLIASFTASHQDHQEGNTP